MSTTLTARAELQGLVVTDYVLKHPSSGTPRELVLLLHGYQQSGSSMFEKLASLCPDDSVVLAPNGTYPLPERKPEGGYRAGYSWYFYNPMTDEYLIDMRPSIVMLEGLIAKLGFAELPKRIVGFSQGGYLAPFAALKLAQVHQVIGIGSEFVADELLETVKDAKAAWPPVFRMDAIHGVLDEIVTEASSRRNFAALQSSGVQGEFHSLETTGHRMDSGVLKLFSKLILA